MATDSQFTLAAKYLPILDEVYKASSKTSILDAANANVKFVGADTVKLFKTSVNGLGDYNRNTGFADGAVSGDWETLTLTQDRGRRFLIDAMSDEETLGMAMMTTMGEFLRTKVTPEIDAYRFAVYAASAGGSASAAITVGTTDVPALIDTADEAMSDNEVPTEGRLLYVSEKAYNGLKSKITRYLANESGVNRNVEVYNNMRVIRVPSGRFYTGITLYDGTTSGQTDGGYVGKTGKYKINFMIVHPSAVVNVVKHTMPGIIAPAQNPDADGWYIKYRVYHDAFVEANKTNGIYVHYDPVALS